jgi:branched-chain amino acid transport system ATP-binding protein
MSTMLDIKDLVGGYGNVRILNGATLSVRQGQIVALLGGNGTGKSTLLKATSGLIRPWSGSIVFDGQRIDGLRPDEIVKRGLVQVTQGKEAFPGMTVEENLRLGGYVLRGHAAVNAGLERVYEYFPVLRDKRHDPAGGLSGGQLQMVCIGRGLMSSPKMLLLDEPSAALAPQVVMTIFQTIHRITRDGMTVLLVEQNVRLPTATSSRTVSSRSKADRRI